MSAPRSRETVTIGGQELAVELLPELGGRIHRIRAFGHDLLRTPARIEAHRDESFFWGAYPMAPWCNRARPGPQPLAGRIADPAPNFVDGSAIHGLVAGVAWERLGPAVLGVEVDEPAWPWRFAVRLKASVDGTTLGMHYRLDNRSDGPMPAGLGLHPWFRTPLEVRLPARMMYGSNAGSPASPEPVAGPFDLSRRAAPAAGLDATWADLDEPVVELAWPDARIMARLSIETSAPAVLVALASPATLGAVAIEPQTHGPDPLRRIARGEPHAPVALAPHASLTLDLRLEVVLARNLR
jgi:aldose 1-epimerase